MLFYNIKKIEKYLAKRSSYEMGSKQFANMNGKHAITYVWVGNVSMPVIYR